MSHRPRCGAVLFCAAAVVALSGCSEVVKQPRTTNIVSNPPGATVLASGVALGVTPLTIHPDEAFPPRFVGLSYRAAGTLTITKSGCKPYSTQVDDAVLSHDIDVDLQCDTAYRPAHATPQRPARESPDASFAARLRRLDALREQGLLSAQEYKRIRENILGEL